MTRQRAGLPSRLKTIFLHRAALWALLLVVLHQSMVASSAYFLTAAIEALQAGGPFQRPLLLYFLAMILPFVPGCLAYVAVCAWANAAHASVVRIFEQRYQGRPLLYRDSAWREKVESIVSRNTFSALSGYIHYLYGLASFSLNSLLSLLVIAYLLPAGVWQGYLVSVAACAAVIGVFSPRVDRLSTAAQDNLARYGQVLGSLWANVTLGNPANLLHWRARARETGARYYHSLTALEWVKQASNGLLGLVTLIPSAYLIYQMVTAPRVEPALVAATLVNLTRIFHILNSLGALVYQVLEFRAADAALRFVFEATTPPAQHAPQPPCEGILLNDAPIPDGPALVKQLRSAPCGRYTLRGPNGSGKTTLLLGLKAADPDNTLYLPVSFEQLAWRSALDGLSSGERMMRVLAEVGEMPEVRCLLLDEWDANLDQGNIRRADAALAELAQRKVVVEVRHRRSALN